jgi:hypothetical protein
MAQSQTDICNSALQRVGAATIMSITDNSREARACGVAYDSNRRAELRKRAWNFALKRAILAPNAVAPSFEYAYAFPLPADCLRVILPKNDPSLDWSVEGRQILTNWAQSPYLGSGSQAAGTGPALYLKYIADITDATQFDPLFYDLFCISLACDICEPLTQSNQKKQLMNAEYRDALEAAAKAKAFEMLPQTPVDDDWWLARMR